MDSLNDEFIRQLKWIEENSKDFARKKMKSYIIGGFGDDVGFVFKQALSGPDVFSTACALIESMFEELSDKELEIVIIGIYNKIIDVRNIKNELISDIKH